MYSVRSYRNEETCVKQEVASKVAITVITRMDFQNVAECGDVTERLR